MPKRISPAFLFRAKRGQAIIGVLLALLGFAAVTQVRTNNADTNYSAYREQDLVDLLGALSGSSQRVQAQIAQLEQTKQNLQATTNDRQAALTQANKQIADLRILAGEVPATGPGVEVTISDPDAAVEVTSLLDLIEELRSAGAEAMSINTVRLVASSAVNKIGGGIAIDGVQLHAPYTLTAIGDPATLNGAVTFARGPEFTLEHDDQGNPNGVTVDVAQSPQVLVRPVVTR